MNKEEHVDLLHKMRYGVSLSCAVKDGLIKFETMYVNRTVNEVIDTKSRMVRDALMALGWTPPPQPTHKGDDDD